MVGSLDPAEVALGVFALAVLFLMPKRFSRWVPPQLLVLVAGTLLALTVFSGAELRLIGEIPTGLPSLQLPVFQADQLRVMLVDGLVLGMLGCIDALLTAMIADSITRTQSDANKELIGQGIGNMMSGLFGGMPGAGATMGTVVNIQAGGKTALSGLVRAGILLVVVLWAAPLTKTIPLAVLAGIAVKVGFDILDWSFLKRAHKVSWKGTAIMYGVMFLTVFVDLIVAVGVGVFIANILTIDRLSKLHEAGQSVWLDFITRTMLHDGGIARRIAEDGVGADELARVQARTEAQLLRQADSVLGRTLAFANAELVHGRAELAGELAARLAAVTPEQVQVAARGLDPGTVAVLELRATGGRR